ncbi:oxidation resistance protein 1 [Rhizophlyctis rosea]|nr:oxidation resistance protein 1 [Rhizophlyctis rosea]
MPEPDNTGHTTHSLLDNPISPSTSTPPLAIPYAPSKQDQPLASPTSDTSPNSPETDQDHNSPPSSPPLKTPTRRNSLGFSQDSFPTSLSGFFWEILGFSSNNIQSPHPTDHHQQRSPRRSLDTSASFSSSAPSSSSTNFLGAFDEAPSTPSRMSTSMDNHSGIPAPPVAQVVSSPPIATGLSEEEEFLRSLDVVTGPGLGEQEEELELVLSPFDDAARGRIHLKGRNPLTEQIMTEELAEKIRLHLPPLLRESTVWQLVYSLDQHGISLNTLYKRAAEDHGPQLLVIKDSDENVFGAFGSEHFHVRTGYYGTGSCFLFKQSSSPENVDGGSGEVKVFHATGENDYLMLSEPHFIALGGGEGHFGLWISEDLFHGHSGPCLTFGNERLGDRPEFDVLGVEVWGFKL